MCDVSCSDWASACGRRGSSWCVSRHRTRHAHRPAPRGHRPQSRELIAKHGLVLGDLSRYPTLDVAIDGADEIDPHLNCIKVPTPCMHCASHPRQGGGGCHVQEKVVACAAAKFVLVADERKLAPQLGE